MLQLLGLDEEGRIALEVSFDIDDMDAALAELDAVTPDSRKNAHKRGAFSVGANSLLPRLHPKCPSSSSHRVRTSGRPRVGCFRPRGLG